MKNLSLGTEKKKRIASQKVLDALALGRKKRQEALEVKRKERDEYNFENTFT